MLQVLRKPGSSGWCQAWPSVWQIAEGSPCYAQQWESGWLKSVHVAKLSTQIISGAYDLSRVCLQVQATDVLGHTRRGRKVGACEINFAPCLSPKVQYLKFCGLTCSSSG